jgi:glutamate--cysteine ligase
VPTRDPKKALTLDAALFRARITAFPERTDEVRIGGVGLEPEFFPIFRDAAGRPDGRVPLKGLDGIGVLETVDGMVAAETVLGTRRGGPIGPWEYPLLGGGRLTFEPGGQVEHSTAVYPSVSSSLEDVDRVVGLLRAGFRTRGAALAAAGMDVWHDVASVPQQLPFGRYVAQAAYYDTRGTWGRVMMRHTASLQINLDLGPEGVWQERWLVANLVSPLITASFACSPSPDALSTRAVAWQELDSTRSGFPAALVDGSSDDPRLHWSAAAMAADVMLFRLGGGRWEPGEAGFGFERWIREGHPDHGWPTVEDLDYHLTTLFLEVRPRGFLELRAGEAVPDCWRAAQVVLLSSLLYDDRARTDVLAALSGHRARLPELWKSAARRGVRDDELRALALTVWEQSLRGAERLGNEYIGACGLDCARRFLDEFTARGRTPADRLRELNEEDPALALAWAAGEDDPR